MEPFTPYLAITIYPFGVEIDQRKRVICPGVPIQIVDVHQMAGTDRLQVEILTVEQDLQPFLAGGLTGLAWMRPETYSRCFKAAS